MPITSIGSSADYTAALGEYRSLAGTSDPVKLQARRNLAKILQAPASQQYKPGATGATTAAPATGGATLSGVAIPEGAVKVGVNSWMSKPQSQTAQAATVAKSPTLQGVVNANPQATAAINPLLQPTTPPPPAAPAAEPAPEPAPTVYDDATLGLANGGTGFMVEPDLDAFGFGTHYVDPSADIDKLGLGNGAPALANGTWDDVVAKFSNYVANGGQYKMPSKDELRAMFSEALAEEIKNLRQAGGVDAKQLQQRRAREQYLADRGISFDSNAYRTDQSNTEQAIAAEDAGIRSQANNFAVAKVNDEFKRALDSANYELDSVVRPFESAGAIKVADKQLESGEKKTKAQIISDQATTKGTIDSQEAIAKAGLKVDLTKEQWRTISGNLQFLSSQGFNLKELSANVDKWAADRGLTKETFYAQLNSDTEKWKEDFKVRRKATFAAIDNAKDMTALEKSKLKEMIRSNRATEAIQMLAVRKSGGGKSPDDIYNAVMAEGTAKAELAKLYPELYGPKKEGSGGISVGFGG
jgi:hypothetical protein